MGPGSAARSLTLWVLYGALTFNAALCFVNTVAARVSDAAVMGCEALLIATALGLALRRDAGVYVVLAVFLSYAALLMAMRPLLDPKAVRDFLIPVAFYALGRRWSDPRLADRAALVSGLVVLVFGLFEAIALDTYVHYFNIAKYYVARGSVVPVDAAQKEFGTQASALFESGTRPDARTILPFLGPHRTSSVFLEPVSMGNFGAILLPVGAVPPHHDAAAPRHGARRRRDRAGRRALRPLRLRGGHWRLPDRLAAAAAPVVRAALRHAGGFAVYASPAQRSTGRTTSAAACCGRRGSSPRSATGPSGACPPTSRSSAIRAMPNSLNQIGIVGLVGFWALFIFVPERNAAAWRFKCCVATYVCLLLVISDSVYSIKTAALLWFMLGSSDGEPARAPALGAERRTVDALRRGVAISAA